jgi:hypothetical protein
MTERRYTDDEIAEIFKRATESREVTPHAQPAAGGLSLTELQGIGQEVGLAPETVAAAARSLEPSELESVGPTRKLLGFPIGVGETVELDRKLTDDEWNQLVVAARETFGARGRLQHDGAFRQWTNGNLQMLLEPTGKGHRIRFKTYNANARGLMMAGVALAGIPAAAAAAALLTSGANAGALTGISSLLACGVALFTIGAGRLPGWSRLRRRQMQHLAAMVEALPPGENG